MAQVDFAILTVVDVERDALLARFGFGPRHRVQVESRVYWQGAVSVAAGEDYQVVIAKCADMGNLDAQAAVQDCVRHCQPAAMLLVGIAAGRGKGQTPGDLVLGRHVYYYERTKLTPSGPAPEPYMVPADPVLWGCADNMPDWTPAVAIARPDGTSRHPVVHKGVIASGEKVLAEAAARDEIAAGHRKIAAIEMEGFGFAKGCHEAGSRTRALVVRALSDFGDAAKSDDWHKYAMAVAADFVMAFLLARPIEPVKKKIG